MDMDLLTGLLLTAVVVLGIGYAVRELAGDTLKRFVAEHTAQTSEDPNKRLIGARGEVVGAGSDNTLKVRVGIERWDARLEPEPGPLPAGTEVRIAGVEGLTLRVEQAGGD